MKRSLILMCMCTICILSACQIGNKENDEEVYSPELLVPQTAVSSLARSRDTQREADLMQVRSSLEMYFAENGTYPAANTYHELESALVPNYIRIFPTDPLDSQEYRYYGSATSYELVAVMEVDGQEYRLASGR